MAPSIQIIKTPIGDAPLKIREAWIGMVIPLHGLSGAGLVRGPVVSIHAQSTGIRSWLRAVFRQPYPEVEWTGYVVSSAQAIDLLGEIKPWAAQWWRRHTPIFLQADQTFMFDAECCRLVEAPGD